MAGHSKWSNIKHRKQSLDNKRSKLFHKLSKDLAQALKGGDDPKKNAPLRNVLLKMKSANMPKEAIERAIKKSQNINSDSNFFWLTALFQKQIFFICKLQSANKTLTEQEFKKFLQKNKTEVLPVNALKSYFREVFKIILLNISDEVLEEMISSFNIMDFMIHPQEKKIILFFENPESLKDFQNYLFKKEIKHDQFQKTFLPITRTEVDSHLKDDFLTLCEKIINTKNCLSIIDNLVK